MNLREACHASVARRGFTLTELLLSVTLIFIISSFMFPVSVSFLRSQMLNETTEGVLSVLRKAQSMALTGRNDTAFGVKIQSDTYILFEGDSFATRAVERDEIYPYSRIVSVSGFDEMVFSELTGVPSVTGVLTLSIGERQEHIEVSALGSIAR